MKTLVGLLGGTLAAGTHFTKAGTRAAANTSPEPFSNWMLSLSEDVFVVSLGFVALKYPLVAALIVIVAVAMMLVFATWIARAVRRQVARRGGMTLREPVNQSSCVAIRLQAEGGGGETESTHPPADCSSGSTSLRVAIERLLG